MMPKSIIGQLNRTKKHEKSEVVAQQPMFRTNCFICLGSLPGLFLGKLIVTGQE